MLTKEQFDALTVPQQRVEVAKDIIKQVKLDRLVPMGNIYCSVDSVPSRDYTDLSKAIRDGLQCHVCAKGAIAMSMIGFGRGEDGIRSCVGDPTDFPNDASILGVFDAVMLSRMEALFEGWAPFTVLEDRYKNHHDRMIALMQHIIDTNGEPTWEFA